MSDIFHEVEEEVRRERFEKLWKLYGDYIIAGVALFFIALAGYILWDKYQTNERLKASETLIAAQAMADNNNLTGATAALAVVAKNAPGGYAKMARLSEAGVLLATGRRVEAVEIYKALATDDSGAIGRVALLRAGWALADSAPRKDVEALLAPLNDPKSPWRHPAREILAYADFHAGNVKKAQAEFQALADDKDAPEQMRRRVLAMATFLKNGGLANFGTVPQAPVAPTDPAGPVSGSLVPVAPGAPGPNAPAPGPAPVMAPVPPGMAPTPPNMAPPAPPTPNGMPPK